MGIQEQIDDARNSYEQISASDNPSAELEQKVRMHPKGISQTTTTRYWPATMAQGLLANM